MKKLLILSLMLSICAYANTQPFSRAYMMNMLFEAYSFAYYDTPRRVEDLLRFIDLNEETRQVYAWEHDYLKTNEKDLIISSEGSNVVLKTTDGRKIFYGDIYMPYSRGDGMKGRINFFDKYGYYFQSDSLDAAFREARIEVVKKYHPNWEPAPKEYERWIYRFAVFNATLNGLKPMFQEDSIDTTTDYYHDLERMALKFLSDHNLSRIIFDRMVFKKHDDDDTPHDD